MTHSLQAAVGDDPCFTAQEEAARRLEQSSNFRVLRRLPVPAIRPEAMNAVGNGRRLALLLDTETTGIDRQVDDVIELSMVAATYDDDGLHDVVGVFEGLEDPGRPLSPEIVRLTGLTDVDLRGRRIDRDDLEAFLKPASLVIAHNAKFDRPFAELVHPTFAKLPWACSLEEIEWSNWGGEGRRLGDLLRRLGLFHDGHRALSDCQALLAILRAPLAADGPLAFVELLRSARRTTVEVRALGAPFHARHALKARRYRWMTGADGTSAWTIVVSKDVLDEELLFLRALLPASAAIPVRALSAFDRYR